jgi:LacI family transcriptional regulator
VTDDSSNDTGRHRPEPDRTGRRKANLADVARLAGVGIATVDRVLNERGNVSPATARKVIEASRELSLPRILPMPYRRGLRLDVVMAGRGTPFWERVNAAFLRAGAALDRSVIVQRSFVDEARPHDVARYLLSTNADALILYGQEHVAIVDAVTTLTSNGIPVVTMVSDLPTTPRLAYVGTDHYSTGRTAAFFMGRMVHRPGPVLVLCHSFDYRAHAERVSGFHEGLADHAAGLAVFKVLEGHDHQQKSEQLLRDQFGAAREPIVGIYNTGGANRAVERALAQVEWTERPVFIGHELTVHTARMLSDGVMTLAIDQNPEEQARRAIEILLRRFGYTGTEAEPNPVPFTIYGPENIPPAGDRR